MLRKIFEISEKSFREERPTETICADGIVNIAFMTKKTGSHQNTYCIVLVSKIDCILNHSIWCQSRKRENKKIKRINVTTYRVDIMWISYCSLSSRILISVFVLSVHLWMFEIRTKSTFFIYIYSLYVTALPKLCYIRVRTNPSILFKTLLCFVFFLSFGKKKILLRCGKFFFFFSSCTFVQFLWFCNLFCF